MLSIFVISNDTIMGAIEYIKKICKGIIQLFYATCTNDLILYSKQASNIEIFILAFFIECNRHFIADSLFMDVFKKYL
jgi:hypothetical protein